MMPIVKYERDLNNSSVPKENYVANRFWIQSKYSYLLSQRRKLGRACMELLK